MLFDPSLQRSAERRRGLTLVCTAPEQVDVPPCERRCIDGPPPLARPSDRLEPWLLEGGPSLIAFAHAAYERRVPFQVAASVVLERRLLNNVLKSNELAGLIADLDLRAQVSSVDRGLSDGLAAYVRVLSGSVRELDRTPPQIVALPMRLIERLGETDSVVELLDFRLLDSARAWELAAALAGLTMTEWAGLAAFSRSR